MQIGLLLLSLLAAPAPPERAPRGVAWDAWGSARTRATLRAAATLDPQGTPSEDERSFDSRLIVGGRWSPLAVLDLVLEVEGLSGRFAGDLPEHGSTLEAPFRHARDARFGVTELRPRQAYLQLALPFGVTRVGLQAFTWGTGMLAHDGRQAADFGDPWQGNLVNRALVLLRPLRKLFVFAGADAWYFDDDNAVYAEGDRAFGGVLGLRWMGSKLKLGLLQALRRQEDRADPLRPDGARTTLLVAATDLYAKVDLGDFGVEAEAAMLLGETDRPYLEETFEEGASILAFGGLLRGHYTAEALSAQLELGYASGDNDPRDAVVRQFTFNTDYEVGLLIFDHLLPLLSARAVDRVNDEGLLAVRPSGLRHTVEQGGVRNALYLMPVLRYRPWTPLELRAGYLYARAAADLVSVYESARAGGFNATHGGRSPGERELGHELLGAFRYSLDAGLDVQLHLGAEAAWLVPGAAFDGLDLPALWLARARMEVTW